MKCKIKFNYHNNKTNLGNNSDNINEIATSLPDEEIDTDNDNNGNMKYKNITDANNEERLDNQKYVNNAENSEWLRTPISPESAYQIANILQGAVIRGTSSKLAFLNLPIGAKTGTSDGGKDMWTIAFSSNYVIGAYVGYDAPIETNNYGSQYALPIVRDILTYLSEREEIKDIIPPSGIKFVKINRFTGRQTTKNDNINKQQDTSLIDLNQQDNESGAVMEQDNEQGDVSTNNQTKQDIKVFSKETAYQIINMLQGAVKRGTSSRLSSLGLPIASKTGTSNGGRDMWNVVISPELVIAVYVGFDQPMDTDNYGSQYALPVSKEILTSISNNENYHFNDFISPESIKFVKINRHTGKQTSDEQYTDITDL